MTVETRIQSSWNSSLRTRPRPELTVSPIVTMACEDYDPTAIYAASATDACGDATVSLQLQSQGSGSCAGTYLHTYIATDECENDSDPYQQVVNLVRTKPPLCPAWISAQRTKTSLRMPIAKRTQLPPPTEWPREAPRDNCDNAPEVSISLR